MAARIVNSVFYKGAEVPRTTQEAPVWATMPAELILHEAAFTLSKHTHTTLQNKHHARLDMEDFGMLEIGSNVESVERDLAREKELKKPSKT